ncbi:MAG: 2-amino-4-hydroxy-6-hydroxymethyldihydropteridine diphosphokinase [Endomicrobium sp.]|jgi:2-amino-4-hydroxy-6-hydroxymethyldihydropteridine diphosphokinase|nr:2-amino-4-hydroxy-6-hydroxymethyldihydropteridine diphosphokinase [Endomicrobium sp.]
MKETIYLSLGSNIGDRAENIISTLSFLQSSLLVNIIKLSSFYETSPIGPKQRSFYNIVIKAYTELNSYELFYLVKQAEHILARRKVIKWGPRIIDVDILFFGNQIIDTILLTIPHKEIENRLFVLVPMNEIESDFVHPTLSLKINTILSNNLLTFKCQKIRVVQVY